MIIVSTEWATTFYLLPFHIFQSFHKQLGNSSEQRTPHADKDSLTKQPNKERTIRRRASDSNH